MGQLRNAQGSIPNRSPNVWKDGLMTKLRSYPAACRHLIGRGEPLDNADPERLAAARIIAERSRRFEEAGIRVRPWRPAPGTPASRRSRYGTWEWDTGIVGNLLGGWLDHPYKLLMPDGGKVFVSEPYGLAAEDIAGLQRLEEQGWRVSIRPDRALHFPGRTVAVWITR